MHPPSPLVVEGLAWWLSFYFLFFIFLWVYMPFSALVTTNGWFICCFIMHFGFWFQENALTGLMFCIGWPEGSYKAEDRTWWNILDCKLDTFHWFVCCVSIWWYASLNKQLQFVDVDLPHLKIGWLFFILFFSCLCHDLDWLGFSVLFQVAIPNNI